MGWTLFLVLGCLFLGTVNVSAYDFEPPSPKDKSPEGVFTSHMGEWNFKGGAWNTEGEQPPGGWYLRSLKKHDLDSVEFSVRKKSDGSYIYLYTDDWRVLLKDDEIIVNFAKGTEALCKYFRAGYWFWNGLSRPIEFKAGTWKKLKLTHDGDSVKIDFNGKRIVDWSSPEQEWVSDGWHRRRWAFGNPILFRGTVSTASILTVKRFLLTGCVFFMASRYPQILWRREKIS